MYFINFLIKYSGRNMQRKSPIHKIPELRKRILELEEYANKHSWPAALKDLAAKTGTKINTIIPNEKTRAVLEKAPTLIVANHPFEIEVLTLIASLPNRKDIQLIANVNLLNLVPSAKSNFIPVYVSHKKSNGYRSTWLRRKLDKLNTMETETEDVSRTKNRQSIALAAKRLSKGALVIIFPDRHSKDGHWYPGVGHVINQTTPNQDINIVFSFISGTGPKDIWRLIPGVRRFFPTIKVYFSEAMGINEYKTLSPRETTTKLERLYRDWVNSIGEEYKIIG